MRNFPKFSLFIPDGARVVAIDSTREGLRLEWPDCARCRFGVEIQTDSGIGLEARIARIVARQRAIDSINHDPHTVVHEFDEIDRAPQALITRAGRGYLLDNNCEDCAARELLFAQPGYVAQLAIGGDNDVPNLGRHLCEMTAVGKTFAWRSL